VTYSYSSGTAQTESPQEIEIDGRTVTYTVKRSPRARYARLEVRASAGLVVIVPESYPLSRIADIILAKKLWVFSKLTHFSRSRPNLRRDSHSILYLGQRLKLTSHGNAGSVDSVFLKQDELVLTLRKGSDPALLIRNWLKQQAAKIIGNKAEHLSRKIGINYCRLTIRSAKTRWASCSPKGNLSFNWKVMMVPEPVIDYVVIHELCHLRHMNHSPRFWKLVEKHCPEWRAHRKWLRAHENELTD